MLAEVKVGSYLNMQNVLRKVVLSMDVLERFLKYVSFDTQSADDCECVPSTAKQHELAKYLADELKGMKAGNVRYDDEHCYVYASIPATSKDKRPVIGFISHMDTSNAISGKDVKPRIVENYDGSDIILNKELNIVMSSKEFPSLKSNIGKDLIVTDGTTLLGADDKAGVAEIMTMAEYLLAHPEIEHGEIRIGFTPDEEVGNGVAFFDVEGFDAEYAYTVDGGELGEIEYENFNAASANVTINGKSIHPGSAKGQMINALLVGMELQSMLPVFENPAYTEMYEGFYHLDRFEGSVESAKMFYIIRDHDLTKFESKKERFKKVCDYLNDKYGEGTVVPVIKDSYYNMKEKIEPCMFLIDNAKDVLSELGVVPKVSPIRGGTDGARLSFMGLPCPNLCTGGYNFHGKYEYIPKQSLYTCTEMLIKLACR